MNNTLTLCRTLCPNLWPTYGSTLDTLIRTLYTRNLTFEDKYNQLATYSCRVAYVLDLQSVTIRYGIYAKWIAFAFGFVGSLMALIVLTRKEYARCVTMMYHRSINFLEIFSSLIVLHGAIHSVYSDQLLRYKAWAILTADVTSKLQNCLFSWVNLIVLWVAIERVLGCLFVAQFTKVNHAKMATLIIAGAGVLSMCIFLPYGFGVDYTYNNSTGAYQIVQSDWAKSPKSGYSEYSLSLSIIMITHSVSLLAASLTALRGLIAMTIRKRALAGSWKESKANDELVKQCSFNIQLCVLQMCETVPCVLNQLLFCYITIKYNFITHVITTLGSVPLSMSYVQANDNIDDLINYLILGAINGVGVLISHFARFYWYIIFSPKVRGTFARLIMRRRQMDSRQTSVTNVKSNYSHVATVKVKPINNAMETFDHGKQ